MDFEPVLRMMSPQKKITQKIYIQTFSTFFLDLNIFLTDFRHNGPELPRASGGWINTIKLREKINERFDLREILTSIESQKGEAEKPHNSTFLTFFLDLNIFLTDFRHNGPELPWAAGGRMAGLYTKKVNKTLTGIQFLGIFLPLYAFLFNQISRILASCIGYLKGGYRVAQSLSINRFIVLKEDSH